MTLFLLSFRKKYAIYAVAAIHSLALLLVCYAFWNIPYTFSSESGFIKYFNVLGKLLYQSIDTHENLVVVNVAYDRELVEIHDEIGIPAGNIDITDRAKLMDFFRYINKQNNHNYILCDVFFDSKLTTVYDDSLFFLMANTPRLVVPKHQFGSPLPSVLAGKSAFADFKTNIVENNLLKYQFIQHREKSLPLYIWMEITGSVFERRGLRYLINGQTVTNSVILDFPVKIDGAYASDGTKNYYNLGSDLLEFLQVNNSDDFFKDKFVIIGDLSEKDIHQTVAGIIPGALINYNAYLALLKGKVKTPFMLWCVMFFVFYFTSLYIAGKRLNILKIKMLKSDLIRFAFNLLGFSFILLLINLFVFFVWGRFVEIFLFSGYFALINTILELRSILKNKSL